MDGLGNPSYIQIAHLIFGSSGGSVLAGFSAQGEVLKAVPVPLLCWRVRLGRNPDHPQARPTCVTNGQDQRRGTGIALEMTGCVRFRRMSLIFARAQRPPERVAAHGASSRLPGARRFGRVGGGRFRCGAERPVSLGMLAVQESKA
jgi:hypothetical protein